VAAVAYPLLRPAAGDGGGLAVVRWVAWAAAAAGICLLYFDYRSRRFSPAVTEARLMALAARIRPHFLFNSLNAVLGVIRSDPRRAERALEELADLFRVVMRDNRELVPLGDEITLCERYLDIERLRLGERLIVRWDTGQCPRDALVPPLLLQPLVENAVYHGIEPAAEAGEVVIRLLRRGSELHLEVDNPLADRGRQHVGNRMALDNIRERLMLFFDLEAGLDIARGNGRHRVHIHLPYRRTTP
jgi:two-component system sensor histidine kinase AlgZ